MKAMLINAIIPNIYSFTIFLGNKDHQRRQKDLREKTHLLSLSNGKWATYNNN